MNGNPNGSLALLAAPSWSTGLFLFFRSPADCAYLPFFAVALIVDIASNDD